MRYARSALSALRFLDLRNAESRPGFPGRLSKRSNRLSRYLPLDSHLRITICPEDWATGHMGAPFLDAQIRLGSSEPLRLYVG